MYDRTFGTDWDTLENRDEALWRAFGLGVAECLGEDYPGELDRVSDAAETNYDRSFAELAYQKGRQHVRQFDDGTDPAEIWRILVEERSELDLWADPGATLESASGADEGTTDDENDGADDETGLPDSLQGFRVDSRPADSTDRVQRPSLLDRDSEARRARNAGGDRSLFGGRRRTPGDDDDAGESADSADRGNESELERKSKRKRENANESGRKRGNENENENETETDSDSRSGAERE